MTGSEITASVAAANAENAARGSVVVFSLGPDGTTFEGPVDLEWDGPWSPTGAVTVSAFDGNGKPIDNGDASAVNTVRALRIEPTSATTAHYRLPIDHFSTWAMTMTAGNVRLDAVTIDATVGADGATLDIVVNGSLLNQPSFTCVSGDDRSLRAGTLVIASATFDQSAGCWSDTGRLRLNVRCAATGSTTIEGQLKAVVMGGDLRYFPSDVLDLVQRLARSLPPEYGFLTEAVPGIGLATFTFRQNVRCDDARLIVLPPAEAAQVEGAAMVPPTVPVVVDVVDVPTPPIPTPLTGPVAPVTVPRLPSATTSVPAGSSSTSSSAPSTSSTSTSPSSSVTTSTITTATSSSTSSSTSTSTTSSSTTSTLWDTGRWDHNEYGSCDWNNSGGCGIYLGDSPGVYRIGPLGDADTRFS
ncbi:MAG: hypothetical protein AB7O61_16175 [Acidimicrobiia bacterium]